MKQHLLSKSTFIRSLQCSKSLYLYKMQYALRDVPDEGQQLLFDRGHQVGSLAKQLYPGGKDAGWRSPRQYKRSVKKTAKFIEAGAKVIYEAAFLHDDVLVALDILVKKADGWHGYEVKSGTTANATYVRDAALQYHVICSSGLPLRSISVIHINKQYVRGRQLNVEQMFIQADITSQVLELLPFIKQNLYAARHTLSLPEPPEPGLGPHCEKPYPCDFRGYCWKDVNPNSVLTLRQPEEESRWKWHQNGIAEIKDLQEIDSLSELQRIEIKSRISGEVYMHKAKLAAEVNTVKFPAAFVHIEYLWTGIPLLEGIRPYQRLPFAYSLQRLGHICAEPQHRSHLAETGGNAIKHLAEKLLADTQDMRQVLVYDAREFGWVFKAIGEMYPELAAAIRAMTAKTKGIAQLFPDMTFYHPARPDVRNLGDVAAILGMEALKPLPAAALEQLFYQNDIFKVAALRDDISKHLHLWAASLLQCWKLLREESMK